MSKIGIGIKTKHIIILYVIWPCDIWHIKILVIEFNMKSRHRLESNSATKFRHFLRITINISKVKIRDTAQSREVDALNIWAYVLVVIRIVQIHIQWRVAAEWRHVDIEIALLFFKSPTGSDEVLVVKEVLGRRDENSS